MNTIYEWFEEHDITIKNKKLMEEALTHSSYINENRGIKAYNERIEFVGDAVLQIWVSERLYKLVPPISEGEMTVMRKKLVCEQALSEFMLKFGWNQFLKLGHGEEKNGGRTRAALIADGFEAIIGALYLGNGMDDVTKILDLVMKPLMIHPENSDVKDYKTTLQEYIQSDNRGAIRYVLLNEQGPSNGPHFEIGVYLDDVLLGKGNGTSKKRAEQMAAKEALDKMVK